MHRYFRHMPLGLLRTPDPRRIPPQRVSVLYFYKTAYYISPHAGSAPTRNHTDALFVIQNISAWCPAIRSKTAIRSGVKRCFCDPSIPIALLGLSPESLSMQLKTFGFIFEQMCIRDLKAYTIDLNSHVSYYHDRYDLEADIVLHLEDGRYALIECKLGSREIDDGAKHLLELKRLIQEHNKTEKQVPIREPDLLIVMTGGTMAYTRPDGVKVIPLACLKD